jgi:hypothetical protein
MPLAEAIARSGEEDQSSPPPHLELHDPLSDRLALERLAQWCGQFSPIVGLEQVQRPDTLLLDVTGIAPLFGGEDAFRQRVLRAFQQRGLTFRAAITDTLGASWAIAHYGVISSCADSQLADSYSFFTIVPSHHTWSALVPLPISAFRLPAETVALLAELGLHTIGQLEGLSRKGLYCRFGPELSTRLDQATGALALVSYAAVDDCGRPLNTMIVEGQTHGSIAQGLGQAMLENAIYDSSGGQLVTGSFMDYAMPRASDMPAFKDAIHSVPATTNPLGVKGAGEAGTTAAIAAVMNAIADAIPGGAGAHLDMPATPEKLWQACQRAAQA